MRVVSRLSSVVEHIHGKDGVLSSSLKGGSKRKNIIYSLRLTSGAFLMSIIANNRQKRILSTLDREDNVMSKKLYRSRADKKIAGVCGGLAEYFNIDPVIVRIGFVILLLPGGFPGLLPYIILWLIVPEAPNTDNS